MGKIRTALLLLAAGIAAGCGGRIASPTGEDGSYRPQGDPVLRRVSLGPGTVM